MATTFSSILSKFRKTALSERDKGYKFERLMQGYLQTDPQYAHLFKHVWLWNDFFARKDFGGSDTGIDLVALTHQGDFWAIQCKCWDEASYLNKEDVDTFLSTSSRSFKNEQLQTAHFAHRLWISTSRWGSNAEQAILNQQIPVTRIGIVDLENASVDWDKLEKGLHGEPARSKKKPVFPHVIKARDIVHDYFKEHERGKLIMACGTGKTICSLKIAEKETDGKGLILFLVPSIALLGQTLREWTSQADEAINAICICSDAEVSKDKKKNEDTDGFSVVDLALPASTDVKDIVGQLKYNREQNKEGMTVVFSTYQSIDVISRAQKQLIKETGTGVFDLIVCDEAHRTTGVKLAGDDSSSFVKVHDGNFLQARKRLYMTATPRLYSDESKSKADQYDAAVWSMDSVEHYGEEIYRIGFGEAVEKGLLTDYKVLILTLNEHDVPEAVQKIIADKKEEINTDDASKLIGCINALSKNILGDEGVLKDSDPEPMRTAVAFCQSIAVSKKITAAFNTTKNAYYESLPAEKRDKVVAVFSDHVDGTMSAPNRDEKLQWLKSVPPDTRECRILTNVRCLSEGVDVPSLDAVLFLSARNSQVDVVQSVGRVMRKSPGKKYGYIIIPVLVPSNVEADKALDKNENYKVVWTVLNALRAHDDRFNATVNKIELNKQRPNNILVGRPDHFSDRVSEGNVNRSAIEDAQRQLMMQFNELQGVVFARMVQKVGDKRYWEQWAKSVADIATRHTARITKLVNEDTKHQKAFDNFLKGLHKNINPAITQPEAIEMLSQHIITKPVFDALFEGYSFVKHNPMSQSMQKMLDLLEEQSLEKDAETLQKFYDSVKTRASGIDNAEGKQRIIVELYDKFFKTAFPKLVEKLGIVYTPVEVVDFIVHSVADVLQKEFGRSISDENIHILDPFTGTGTFITRLLQSGVIEQKDLERKYRNEIHANEIVLLAYYIAAINIENAYHDLTPDPDDGIGKENYTPFEGICLTDTFQLGETQDGEKLFSEMFPQNSKRVQRQKKAPLRIIMGNPPYSIGQKSANDNAQNQEYPQLDARISDTYAKLSDAGLSKSLYDAYIKAFRWSSDRLDKNGGIICFVSNGAWLDGNSTDGFRKSIEKEFSSIYVFNLRGNARTSGELRQKEAGNVFGGGSRTPISITLLVKNPDVKTEKATIHYHDIGDYLDREEKLKIIRGFKTFENSAFSLKQLQPNEHGDWISVRNDAFGEFVPLSPDKKFNAVNSSYFVAQSNGVLTAKDSWLINSSKNLLTRNIESMLSFYNEQRLAFQRAKQKNNKQLIEDFVIYDSTKISWSDLFLRDADKNIPYEFEHMSLFPINYRPFNKQLFCYDKKLIQRTYQMQKLFPKGDDKNIVICISCMNSTKGISVSMTDSLVDYHYNGDTQCFPLYYYEENTSPQNGLFDSVNKQQYVRRDGISDFILERAQKQYGKSVSKEDVFYYVYGFLHSPSYRTTFANDLKKMLPRLPLVDEPKQFWAFSKAGRALAELHLNYEQYQKPNGVTIVLSPDYAVDYASIVNEPPASFEPAGNKRSKKEMDDVYDFFRVEKMRFPSKADKSSIIYNSKITIDGIPAEAYEYVVNGKSAIEWIMERYQITIHKESGIRNDPNDWSKEHNQPKYILDLLLSIIAVSVETVKIVRGLPEVKWE